MQSLFQSNFLQSLGFAIANSLWQTAIVWLLYFAVSHIFRVSSAAKYRMAVAAQLTSFIWFIFTVQFYYGQYNEVLRNSAALLPDSQKIQAVLAGENSVGSQVIRMMIKAEQVLPYISMAYIVLMVFLAIRWVAGYSQTQLMRTQGLHKIPVNWRLFVKDTAEQLGIKKDIRLFLSENITTPLTIGFLKPIILIPVASINHLTTQQLEAVLLHELAHIKRFDYLVNIILSVAEITLFFNPFTQLLSKSIRKERENSCDDWVLQFKYAASDYAEALLRIALLQQQSPAFAMAAAGKKNELLIRVKRMIGEKENRFNYRRQLLALVMVTAVMGCMAWLDPVVPAKEKNKTAVASNTAQPAKTIAIEPMAMKVENPLFNPVFFLSEPLKKEMAKNLEAAKEELEALVVPGGRHEGLIESIPPMVANALDKASFALDQLDLKTDKLDKEFASMEMARKKMGKVLADSLGMLPFMNTEYLKSLGAMQVDFDKAKEEFTNFKKLRKDIPDTDKIKKDIQKAMDELAAVNIDKLMAEAFTLSGNTITKKETAPASSSKQNKENKEPVSPPQPKSPEILFREKHIPSIRISNNELTVGDLTISQAFLKDIQKIAELVKNIPAENVSPEIENYIRQKIEKLMKEQTKKNKVTKTVITEEENEEAEETIIQLQ